MILEPPELGLGVGAVTVIVGAQLMAWDEVSLDRFSDETLAGPRNFPFEHDPAHGVAHEAVDHGEGKMEHAPRDVPGLDLVGFPSHKAGPHAPWMACQRPGYAPCTDLPPQGAAQFLLEEGR